MRLCRQKSGPLVSDPQILILGGSRRGGRRVRAEARSQPFPIRLSPAERSIVEQAASVNRQNLAQFGRDALLTAAAECLETKPE